MEIANVEAALEKVRGFITLLEQHHRVWNATGSTLDNPQLRQLDSQV